MTDFVDDYTDAPETKVDATAVPASASTTRYVRAADVNKLSEAVTSLRTSQLGGKRHGLRSSPTAAVGIAGNADMRSNNGILEASENGKNWTAVKEYVDAAKFCARDGVTDDSAAISTALAEAVSRNLPLYFPPGTYMAKNVAVTAPVRILGDRGSSIIKLPALASLDASPIFNVTSDNVSFTGLTLNGNKAAQPADGYSDSFDGGGNGKGRAYRAAIKVYSSSNTLSGLRVEGCDFTATYGACIAAKDVTNTQVLNNTADSCNFELLYLNSSGSYLAHHQVTGNRATNVGSGDASVNSDCVVLNRATDAIVSGNVFDTIERNAAKLEICKRVQFVNNSISNITKVDFSGVQSQAGGEDILIADNRIFNAGSGIQINNPANVNIAVLNNVIHTTTGASIADGINIGTGSIDGMTISGNVMSDIKRHGIHLNPSSTVTGLTISGNRYKGQGTNYSTGIYLVATGGNWKGITVQGNNMDAGGDVQTDGGIIAVSRTDSSKMDAVSITGNVLLSGVGHRCFSEDSAVITQGIFDGNLVDGYVFFTSTTGWRIGPTNVVPTTGWVGAKNLSRVVLTTPATVNTDDTLILTNLTAPGAVAIALPSSPAAHHVYTIKDAKGDSAVNNITVTPASGTVDGAASKVISSNYGALRLLWDGTTWFSV